MAGMQAYASDIVLVTPDNDATLENNDGEIPAGFVVGTLGDVRVLTGDGRDIVVPEEVITAKQIFPLAVRKIFSTNTTAAVIYVLYGAG